MKKTNTIKLFGIIAFVVVIGFSMAACGGDDDGGGSGGNTPGGNTPGGNSGGGTETGLYMGIIGFNESVTKKEIGLLNSGNKSQFQTFINSLTSKAATGLYYAVDNGLNMLQSATLPNDLTNVAIVTFTDGLDNVSIDLNTNYNSRDAYRDALRNRISTTKIKNLNINAYSIGIRGGDVQDIDAFRAGLDALASTGNRYEVSSMAEVNNTFRTIANSLYNESQTQSVKLRITSGYDDGTKIRFTFDSVTDAANSNLYIEGTYKRNSSNRSLENVVYQGLSSSSGTTVSGSLSGVYATFTFQNVSTSSGGNVNTQNTQQWEYVTSQSRWQKNSEFGQTGDTETIVDRKSAVIMLVLDCTTSLDAGGANGFSQMKVAANNFIDVLMSGGGNTGGGNNTGGGSGAATAVTLTAGQWANGNLTSGSSVDWYKINATAGTTYHIWWNDVYTGNGTKTADVEVLATFNDNTISGWNTWLDSSWNDEMTITVGPSSGTIYLRVRPYSANDSYKGTYGIVYKTSAGRP